MSDEKWATNVFDESLGMGNHQVSYSRKVSERSGRLTLLLCVLCLPAIAFILWMLGF